MSNPNHSATDGFVHVRGARVHNLKNVDVRIPRGQIVVFTGVSGSGKSSLAFGTLYAEAQRRYLESVSPYARRLFHQVGVPEVDGIDGLPPAVALQQQRGAPTTRSSVGSVTTLSNLLRMLYSRAGDYPRGQDILYAESFSPNTVQGACPRCHGLGRIYDVTERSMVPDDSLTIRDRAIASWPPAWHGQNLRDILVTMGYDVDRPWRELPKKDRDWILYTEETPTVPVYPGYTPAETRRALKRKEEPSYMGTFTGARKYVLETFAKTESAQMKKRVARYMVSSECPACGGKRLKPEALKVKFEGLDIAEMSHQPLKRLTEIFRPWADTTGAKWKKLEQEHPEKAMVACRIARDIEQRIEVLLDLGLSYLSLERSTPTLSPGELQRLRHPGAQQPVRRGVRAGRAVGRPPPARHRVAAPGPRSAQGAGQLDLRGRARARCDEARRLDRGCGAGRGTAWRTGAVQRARRGAQGGEGIAHAAIPVRRDAACTARAAGAEGLAPARGHHAEQPARGGRRVSARRVHDGDRRVGVGEVEPGEPGTGGAGAARVGA
jgi:excinuclease UvrABC ATPase subunit